MLSGRCLCGGVRYEIDGKLGPIVCCHCSMCRRASGSAFATNASVNAKAFRVVDGQQLVSEYESSTGRFRAFCSRCGSPLYNRSPSRSFVRVRLGTLDSDPEARPVANIWLNSKAPWFEVTDLLERFREGPPQSYIAPG